MEELVKELVTAVQSLDATLSWIACALWLMLIFKNMGR